MNLLIIDQLKETPIFQDLDVQHLEEISRLCKVEQLSDGTVVIEENSDENYDIFIIIKGYLEVVSNTGKCLSDELVLSKQNHGMFGEIGWLKKAKRTASIRSHGHVELIRIDGDRLEEYFDKNNIVGYKVMRRIAINLSNNIKETNTLLKQVLFTENL